jgi:predicted nucleic acid-binding Zn ribbon protein
MKFRYKEKRSHKVVDAGDLIDSLINTYNLQKLFSLEKLKEEWYEITGSILCIHTTPKKIEDDILYITSDHSVFSNDLYMIKGTILNTIKSYYGIEIKDIRITKAK